jgi:lactate dehydrogenase-like 2-hydroxyacid dehydrogenase
MARILVSTPLLEGCLDPLEAHELVFGEPGSDARAEALICAPTQRVDAGAQARMPELRVIAVAGAGADAVDARAAQERGVSVVTAGEGLVETTADLAFGLMIAASRLMGGAERRLRAGEWSGWRFLDQFGRDVHGAELGLVGFGAIGQAVARRAGAFAMRVRHHTRHPTGLAGWVEDLDELLAGSDIVSLHVPLSESTTRLIDARRIALLKPTAVLVNTARGAVVDEAALAAALESGALFAAGLDVYAEEPAVSGRLLAAPRTVLLPHIGSATEQARRAMLAGAASKVAAYLAAAR